MEYFFEQVYLKDQCWPTQWGVVLYPLYSNVLFIDKKRFKCATDLCRYHDCENGFGRLLSIYIFLRLFKANNKSNWGPNLLKLEQFSCFQSVWNDIEYYRKDPHSLRDVMSRVRNMLGSIPIISTIQFIFPASLLIAKHGEVRIMVELYPWSVVIYHSNQSCMLSFRTSKKQKSTLLCFSHRFNIFLQVLRSFVLGFFCKIFSFLYMLVYW